MANPVPDEVEDLLESEPLAAFLGTSADDRPHVAPLWYRYDDGVVEIMTTGQKLKNIRSNPYVSISVQKAEAGIPEWMVTLLGTATVIEDEERNRVANRRINAKYGVDADSWQENTLVRIRVSSVAYKTFD